MEIKKGDLVRVTADGPTELRRGQTGVVTLVSSLHVCIDGVGWVYHEDVEPVSVVDRLAEVVSDD